MNRRVVAGLLLAAVSGLLGLWRALGPEGWLTARAPLAAAPASGPAASAASAAGLGSGAAVALASTDRIAGPLAPARPKPTEALRDPTVWDLCGVGRMPIPGTAGLSSTATRPFYALPAHLGEDALEQALAELHASLESGPVRWRAAALLLRGADAAGRPATRVLAELAQSTADPVVAMWSLQACRPPQACPADAAQRWADLEPDNLVPWLWLLQLSPTQRHDEIFASMARASRHHSHSSALMTAVLEAMPARVPAYLQGEVWVRMIGIEMALPGPDHSPLRAWCPASMPADSDGYRRCKAVGRAMVEQSDTALGTGLGLRLAERTYLSSRDAKAQRDTLDAITQAPNEVVDERQPMSCDSVRRLREWVQLRAQHGELGAWRALAARRAASAAKPAR